MELKGDGAGACASEKLVLTEAHLAHHVSYTLISFGVVKCSAADTSFLIHVGQLVTPSTHSISISFTKSMPVSQSSTIQGLLFLSVGL